MTEYDIEDDYQRALKAVAKDAAAAVDYTSIVTILFAPWSVGAVPVSVRAHRGHMTEDQCSAYVAELQCPVGSVVIFTPMRLYADVGDSTSDPLRFVSYGHGRWAQAL